MPESTSDASPVPHNRRLQDKINPHGPDGKCQAMDDFEERTQNRLDRGSERMDRIEADVKDVKTSLEKNNTDTAEILEIIRAFKGIGRFLSAIGKWMKKLFALIGWAAGILAPIAVLYYTIKNGKPPP